MKMKYVLLATFSLSIFSGTIYEFSNDEDEN